MFLLLWEKIAYYANNIATLTLCIGFTWRTSQKHHKKKKGRKAGEGGV